MGEKITAQSIENAFRKLPNVSKIAINQRLLWLEKALPHQLPPDDDDWRIWWLNCGRGAGKGLKLSTPIPTPNGWKQNGDLVDGDQVFDEHGNVCNVIKAHEPYMPSQLYRMTFSDNSYIDCDGEHLWTVWTHQERKQYLRHGGGNLFPYDWANGKKVRLAQELIEILHQDTARGDLNLCIPNALPLQMPKAKLPIDPYLLGYWLGNGAAHCGEITAGSFKENYDDDFVCGKLESLGHIYKRFARNRGCTKISVSHLTGGLAALHLRDNKHIPSIYLRASADQRLSLLRGLCDSDGWADKSHCEFYNKNHLLAKQVYELVVSLGERATLRTKRAKLNGKDYGDCYTVAWRWTLFNPFSLPRKANLATPVTSQGLRMRHRMITSITPIENQMVRCITVDSPNGLYLCGEQMVPTHNTFAGSMWAWWEAWSNYDARILVASGTYQDLLQTCFLGPSGILSVMPRELIDTWRKQTCELVLKNGSIIRGISAENPERFRGGNFSAAWLDEIAGWQYVQEAFDLLQLTLRIGERPKIVATTTPKPNALLFGWHELYLTGDKSIAIDTASTYDNPHLAENFTDAIAQYEGTDFGEQELYAQLIDPEKFAVFPRSKFRLWNADKPFPKLHRVIQCYDTASSGKDIKDGDYSAMVTLGVFQPSEDSSFACIVLDTWRDKLNYPELRQAIIDNSKDIYGDENSKDGRKVDMVYIENASSGVALLQDLQGAPTGAPVYAMTHNGKDKVQRALLVSPFVAHGKVWLPESTERKGKPRTWLDPWLKEVTMFPNQMVEPGETLPHDDQVDAFSYGLTMLADLGFLKLEGRPKRAYAGDDRKPQNPYSPL